MTPDHRIDDDARADAAAGADDFRFSPRENRAAEIAWRPWGAATFAEAREQHKPVLLSISAVWCHWCHVMDETSYSDPEVIATIAERFVAVRVDNDRRPDVNRRYNMGGWPTTAFLSPTGEVLTGATYLPAEQMRRILNEVADFYSQHEVELLSPRARPRPIAVGAGREGASAPSRPDHGLTGGAVARVARTAAELFDPLHGGLGTSPKFPQTDAVTLLLLHGARSDDERLTEMVLATLRHMDEGEIHDRVGGGFFRYATMRDWSVPHFEKMLDDNARLLRLYLDAYAVTGEARHAETASDIAAFLMETLRRDDVPAFCGSQDADETYYGQDEAGRAALGYAPPLDTTVYVDWNALAAGALLRASVLLDRPDLADAATATLDHLWDEGHTGNGMAHYLGGPIVGLIGDQAACVNAFIDAYEVSGEHVWMARAGVLVDWALQHLRATDGRFTDRLVTSDDAGARAEPMPVLDGTADMAAGMIRLAALAGRGDYRSAALGALAGYAGEYRDSGVFAAPWALAVQRALSRAPHVVVVGDPADRRSRELLHAALCLPDPLRTAQLLDPRTDAEIIAREGYGARDAPTAYACAAGFCSEPTSDPAAIAGLADAAAAAE
jgi:uncharacterized protein